MFTDTQIRHAKTSSAACVLAYCVLAALERMPHGIWGTGAKRAGLFLKVKRHIAGTVLFLIGLPIFLRTVTAL